SRKLSLRDLYGAQTRFGLTCTFVLVYQTSEPVMFHNSADVFLACLSCTLAPCDQHRRPAGGARRADRVGLSAGEREAIAYLIDETRLLRRQLDGPRLRLTDADRRRLAARAHRVSRATPRAVATIMTPDVAAVASAVDRPEMDVRQQFEPARRDVYKRRPA